MEAFALLSKVPLAGRTSYMDFSDFSWNLPHVTDWVNERVENAPMHFVG